MSKIMGKINDLFSNNKNQPKNGLPATEVEESKAKPELATIVEQDKISELDGLFNQTKVSAKSVPSYINTQDLVLVSEAYKRLYDLLEAPTKEEIIAMIEENLHETAECYWYHTYRSTSLAEPMPEPGDKIMLEDEQIKQEVLSSVLRRTFDTDRGNYNHLAKTTNILRTKGSKYLELLLGKSDEATVEECDLDITSERISFDSYSRIITAMNSGIASLMSLYSRSRSMEQYKDDHSEKAMMPASDDEIYPSLKLVSPINGLFGQGKATDSTSLYPTQKHFDLKQQQWDEATEKVGKAMTKAMRP